MAAGRMITFLKQPSVFHLNKPPFMKLQISTLGAGRYRHISRLIVKTEKQTATSGKFQRQCTKEDSVGRTENSIKESKTLINSGTYPLIALAVTILGVAVGKHYFPLLKQHVKSYFVKILVAIASYGPAWIMLVNKFYPDIIPPNLGTRKTEPLDLSLDDIQCVDDAKAELSEIVDIFKEKSAYTTLRAKQPNTVLLYGPPGTGKKSLANATAKEAKLPFFTISARDFAEVGTGPVLIKNLFQEARKFARFIIFINEIEVNGGKGEKFEHAPTLCELLAQMDECNNGSHMVVIASTERLELLDPALISKFSEKVFVNPPDEEGRGKIMAFLLKKETMQDDKQAICNYIASCTQDWVWTDLKNLVDRSIRLAGRRGGGVLTHEDILQAHKKVTNMINDDKDEVGAQEVKNNNKSGFSYTGYEVQN